MIPAAAGGQRIRLQGIDAPDRGQRHGLKATASLQSLILDRRVRLEVQGMGPYRRLVAVVYRDNRSINRWLLRRGHAWEYDRHSDDWMPRWLEWLACVGDESEPVGWR